MHAKVVRDAFRLSGFESVASAADKEFTYSGVTSDFDDFFVRENVIVLAEYTTSQESDISDHLKKKKLVYDAVNADPAKFYRFLLTKFPTIANAISSVYSPHQIRIRIIYCSLNTVKGELKDQVPGIFYYDYNVARYFEAVAKTVRRSARFELFDFLGLESKDIGSGALSPAALPSRTYPGSVLPETHSHFGDGFKVVSFYIDPDSLLRASFVLRRYGWRAGSAVYQRMISRAKIASIRRYLRDRKRVFINNIIVTLPDDTKLLDGKGNTINPKTILDTQPGHVQIPDRFNVIGIVDGQHRVFSYHEGGIFDDEIDKLRKQQNLLVTGVIFPDSMKEPERLKFEAKLFLEINSNQTNARSDLKQEINLVINPGAPESIAKNVVNYMNDAAGPLRDTFERYFFDRDKLKTTSIVSFAVKPLVSPASEKGLFALWERPGKEVLATGSDNSILQDYIKYCAAELNHLFAAVRASLPSERWTASRKIAGAFLTTTNVNGVVALMRRLAEAGSLYTVDEYRKKFVGLKDFPFEKYSSSSYNKLGEKLFETFF